MSHTMATRAMAEAKRILAEPKPASKPGWQHEGACAPYYAETRHDPWYGPDEDSPDYEGGKIPAADATTARKICLRCPVRALCLWEAVDTIEVDGIWAGTTPGQRTFLRKLGTEVAA